MVCKRKPLAVELFDLGQFLSATMKVDVLTFLTAAVGSHFDFHSTFIAPKLVSSLRRRKSRISSHYGIPYVRIRLEPLFLRQMPFLWSRHGRCNSERRLFTKPFHREHDMNWDQIQGGWTQFSGKVKEKWGQLTDDDRTAIEGKRDQLSGKLQQRYGYEKERAEREIDDFARALRS
jgi:uncharacterized protein YjbJ (UPF0337 family)